MLLGMNANPADIIPAGYPLQRFPLWLSRLDHLRSDFDACVADGITPVLVLDRASFKESEWRNHSYRRRVKFWANRFPDAAYIQSGNEVDQKAPSSSYMTRRQYHRLGKTVNKLWPGPTKRIAAGLVKVDFTYFDAVDSWADIAAVHPYAQEPDTVGALIDECRRRLSPGFPLWTTELGTPVAYGTEHERAVWHSEMLIALWRLGVGATIVYRYEHVGGSPAEDFAVQGTESEAAVNGARHLAWTEPTVEPGSGFADHLIADMGDLLGLPYFYGGRDPARGQLDCAGFVLEAFHRQGVNLSYVPVWPDDVEQEQRRYPPFDIGRFYTSAQRLWDNPKIPHVSDPLPGDIAFWERTYAHSERITHCMLWLGHDRYLGAQSLALWEYPNNSAWWRSRFVGFARPDLNRF